MAERRMFAKSVIDSDLFLEMPLTAQLLYFHLAMRADDDGFINKPKAIMKMCGCKDDDMKVLFAKRFVIPFESGVCVIRHWKVHNYIPKDRYKETVCIAEKALLITDKSNIYSTVDSKADTTCIQSVYTMDTQVRLGKNRLDYIPPIVPRGDEPVVKTEKDSFSESFNDFWKAYPKKVSKTSALKAWNKLKPDDKLVREILSALEQQKKSAQWQKDDGQFIPYPTTWLNGRRWEDDLSGQSDTNDSEHSYSLNDYKSLVNNFGGMK